MANSHRAFRHTALSNVNRAFPLKATITTTPLWVFFCFLLLSSIVSANESKTLTILNWEYYLSETVIKQWEAQTGHKVKQVYVDDLDERNSILSAAYSKIDIAVIEDQATDIYASLNVIMPLDITTDELANAQSIDQRWHEICQYHGIPYMWGSVGIAYRSSMISTPPTSWRAITNPLPELHGHIVPLSDYASLYVPYIMRDNVQATELSANHFKTYYAELESQLQNMLTLDYAITYAGNYPTKHDEMHMAVVYAGDEYTLNELYGTENDWRYVVPEEGTLLWVDCMSVLSQSPNKEIALHFINFLNQPEMATLNVKDLGTQSVHRATHNNQDGEIKAQKMLTQFATYTEMMSTETLGVRSEINHVLRRKFEQLNR